MDQIKVSAILNGLGLILDMIGVLLMFQKADVTTYLFNKEEIPGVNKKKNQKLQVGLGLLFFGFVLQLLSLFF